jgi:hypothetical protein
MMKSLVEQLLHHPALIMPMLLLTQLLVQLDFNLVQVTLVLILKGAHYCAAPALRLLRRTRMAPEVPS